MLYAAPSVFPGLPWTNSGFFGSIFRVLASVAAFFLMIYTGFVMSASPAIPFWNTAILPVMFMMYGFIGGLDLLFLLAAFGGEGTFHLEHLEAIQILLMLGTLFFLLVYTIVMYNSSPAGRAAVRDLLTGTGGIMFLGGVVALGLIVPLPIMAYTYYGAGTSPEIAGAAGFLTLIGGLLFRWSVLRAGLYLPLL
jgi:formate-dependent nitrite reductase membrane component NrfD